MKEILAIIRPNKISKTKDVLDALGYPAMTAIGVFGRGKQKAILGEVNLKNSDSKLREECGDMEYVPKRLISLVVPDEDVQLIVEAIMKVNCTGKIGDGKIFICPIIDSVRVRNKDQGIEAIL
ncbi:nitrogen regulatory protein P-II [Methanobrevibacter cuticularis]|uniref:Nitrogen regulatory protein P-II n=1 Tax=Methanobrevibacter cuticularis TaxID=47311 RepID=A0A166DFP2_9EURY|nr:P-II family nitrogen regulator [Methanobrevibacter cuticularis]KZX15552.1 nitrogen regulatory protein P-II [Methanobrevibacter cuticularis]